MVHGHEFCCSLLVGPRGRQGRQLASKRATLCPPGTQNATHTGNYFVLVVCLWLCLSLVAVCCGCVFVVVCCVLCACDRVFVLVRLWLCLAPIWCPLRSGACC